MTNGCVYKQTYIHTFPITWLELTQTAFWTPLAIRNSSPRSCDVWGLSIDCWTHRHRRNAAVIGGLPTLLPIAKIFFIMQSSLLLSYCSPAVLFCPAGDFKRGRSCFWHRFLEAWRSVQVLQKFISSAWDVENDEVEWAIIQGTSSGPFFTSFFSKEEANSTHFLCVYGFNQERLAHLFYLPCLVKLMDS